MANKITLLILIVALGVGCGGKKKSDNPHDMVWIPEKLSKEDSLHGQGRMLDSFDFSQYENCADCGPIAETKNSEALTSSSNNDSLVYQFGDTSEPGGAIDAVMQEYRKYGLPKHKPIIIPLSRPGKQWVSEGEEGIRIPRGTTPEQFGDHMSDFDPALTKRDSESIWYYYYPKIRVARKRGWCCDPGTPSNALLERLWKKSGPQWQFGDTTIVGDSSIKIPLDPCFLVYYTEEGCEMSIPLVDEIRAKNESEAKRLWRKKHRDLELLTYRIDSVKEGCAAFYFDSRNNGEDSVYARLADNGIEYFDGNKWITIPPVQMPNASDFFKGIDTTKKGFSLYMDGGYCDTPRIIWYKKDTTKKHQP